MGWRLVPDICLGRPDQCNTSNIIKSWLHYYRQSNCWLATFIFCTVFIERQMQVQKQTQIQVQYQIGIRSAAGPRWLEADCKHCTSVSLANYHSQYFVPCTFKKLQLSRNTVHLETAPINSLCIFFLKICTSPNLIHSVHRSNNNSASQSLVSRTAQTYSA